MWKNNMKERRIVVVLSQDNELVKKEVYENQNYSRHSKFIFPEINHKNEPIHPRYHNLIVNRLLDVSSFAEPAVCFTHSEAIVLGLKLAVIQNKLEAHGLEIQILGFEGKDWIIEVDEFAINSDWPLGDFWCTFDLAKKICRNNRDKLNKFRS